MKKANLHIFLGAGGVGKTTLSAGLAVHFARQGKKTGLLSIDPARRLQGALGSEGISEKGDLFYSEGTGELRAAMLNLGDSLRRWIQEEGLEESTKERLFEHPLFVTVAERIATATETLAPARMSEWLEQYPETEELIIDTAPGIHAVDFLIRPERMLAFLDSRILEWLKWFAGDPKEEANIFQKLIRGGAKSILNALGKIGGENLILSLGELLLLMDQALLRMVDRIEMARDWIRSEHTKIYLVSAIRDDAVSVINELSDILTEKDLKPYTIALNRSVSEKLINENAFQKFLKVESNNEEVEIYRKFVNATIQLRQSVLGRLQQKGNVTELPVLANLEEKDELRLDDLAILGKLLAERMPAEK